ncbi:hypothetical protein KI387_010293, partial [Taxus chinensis]
MSSGRWKISRVIYIVRMGFTINIKFVKAAAYQGRNSVLRRAAAYQGNFLFLERLLLLDVHNISHEQGAV